mmetsp:Transcript_11810/g.23415  ORF Transcript_11810/g.23415 Transcript_11810/m.23415 type:complete len:204 (-) Transcript_11810:14-625(-)
MPGLFSKTESPALYLISNCCEFSFALDWLVLFFRLSSSVVLPSSMIASATTLAFKSSSLLSSLSLTFVKKISTTLALRSSVAWLSLSLLSLSLALTSSTRLSSSFALTSSVIASTITPVLSSSSFLLSLLPQSQPHLLFFFHMSFFCWIVFCNIDIFSNRFHYHFRLGIFILVVIVAISAFGKTVFYWIVLFFCLDIFSDCFH